MKPVNSCLTAIVAASLMTGTAALAQPRYGAAGDLIAESLKANALFRLSIGDDGSVGQEMLVDGIGRIRDVAVDSAGDILLLIEHASGSRILRLGPPQGG